MRKDKKTGTFKVSSPETVRTAMRDTGILRVQTPFLILNPPLPIKKGTNKP